MRYTDNSKEDALKKHGCSIKNPASGKILLCKSFNEAVETKVITTESMLRRIFSRVATNGEQHLIL
jgi:hypothetical protein